MTRDFDKVGLSVGTVTPDVATRYKLGAGAANGLMITNVSPRGPAWNVVGETEVIVQELYPTKRDIKTLDDMQAAVGSLKSGDVIELKVYNPVSKQTRAVSLQLAR